MISTICFDKVTRLLHDLAQFFKYPLEKIITKKKRPTINLLTCKYYLISKLSSNLERRRNRYVSVYTLRGWI